MRVISGEKRGIPLKAVAGSSTRPTTDKVKEAIFNIIGPYFDGGLGLDLYGGSGGLGIEALSRGVEKVIFVDQNRKAVETIKDNLRQCQLMDRAEVYRNDASRALKALLKRQLSFTHVFLDPPYAKQKLASEIAILVNFRLVEHGGVIVCEHGTDVELPEQIGAATRIRSETYGAIRISIYHVVDDLKGGDV
ncbi:16S rRNA (guanine(966)-N(2))-methyltransferase RsmD [Halalkalibacterium ligniniphilum]|uniref:16S rRNA (guanine(966)-N(2))-methyltransferase RsmD n=1 Tax=Halalkalibacterium ligniniphilum TaxID=1134413 RepID=UPI0003498424|nr:16S rRNA (guanine(966)-N(2))-methyltransferase RsmD [Halalkalibacterium ligniniphilum]